MEGRITDRDGWPIVVGATVRQRPRWTDLAPGCQVAGATGRVARVYRRGEAGVVDFYDAANGGLRTARAIDVRVQRRSAAKERRARERAEARKRRR